MHSSVPNPTIRNISKREIIHSGTSFVFFETRLDADTVKLAKGFGAICVFVNDKVDEATLQFNLPEVALVDIEPETNNRIHFTLQPSQEAGQSAVIENSTDVALWINYTSAMSDNQNTRSIAAEVSQGQIPSGIKLFLEASDISGGNGSCGFSAGKTELTNQPRTIVTDIGNCFTGNGINKGHQVFLSIEISDYPSLKSTGESDFIILYTLTDN